MIIATMTVGSALEGLYAGEGRRPVLSAAERIFCAQGLRIAIPAVGAHEDAVQQAVNIVQQGEFGVAMAVRHVLLARIILQAAYGAGEVVVIHLMQTLVQTVHRAM
jgi:hypothetical protein